MEIEQSTRTKSFIPKNYLNLCFGIIALILTFAIAAYGYIGLFTRYWYDDFCTAGTLRLQGFIGSQIYWYENWSGRFSYHVIVNLFEFAGPRIVTVLPIIALFLWFLATAWAIYQILSVFKLPKAFSGSILLSMVAVFSTVNSTPDIVQSLYWQTGMLSYLAPLIVLIFWIGLLVYALRRRISGLKLKLLPAVAFLLCFIGGGMSETYGILQLGLLGAGLIAGFRYFAPAVKKTALTFILAGFLGASIAFVIVFIAPGNDGRKAVLPPSPPVSAALKSSLSYTLNFAERHSRRSRGVSLLCLIFPAWLALMLYRRKSADENDSPVSRLNVRSSLKIIGLLAVAAFSLMFICFVPAFYSLSDTLPGRAQILPKFVLVVSMMFGGFILMQALLNSFYESGKFKIIAAAATSVILISMLVFVPLSSAVKTFSLGNKAAAFAAKWDEIEREIQNSKNGGARDVVIPQINADEFELGFGRPDMLPTANPKDGQNMCLARYFDLDTVIAEQKAANK